MKGTFTLQLKDMLGTHVEIERPARLFAQVRSNEGLDRSHTQPKEALRTSTEWLGQRNETSAGLLLAPLTYTPTTGAAGDGNVWRPPLSLDC